MEYVRMAVLVISSALMVSACGKGPEIPDPVESFSAGEAPAVAGAVEAAAPVSYVGMKIGDLREAVGPPKARLTTGGRTVFIYDGMELISNNGKTVTEVKYQNE